MMAEVEYSYWARPNELGKALGMKDDERKQRTTFVLYDDGWRLNGEPRFP